MVYRLKVLLGNQKSVADEMTAPWTETTSPPSSPTTPWKTY